MTSTYLTETTEYKRTFIAVNLGGCLGDEPAHPRGLHFQAKRENSLSKGLKE